MSHELIPLPGHDHLRAFAIESWQQADPHAATDAAFQHDAYAILWVQEGVGSLQLDLHSYALEAPCLSFFRPGQMHRLSGTPMSGCWLRFRLDFLCANGMPDDWVSSLGIFNGEPHPPVSIQPDLLPELTRLAHSLADEQTAERPFQADVISGLLKLFLLHAARLYAEQLTPLSTQEDESKLAHQFKQLVDQHYEEWHKVQEYADQLFVTPNYLKDVVKLALGKPAKAIIQDRIMLEAKRRAHFSDASSKEVAFALGFKDPSHFSKFFKQAEGESFSAFRANSRGQQKDPE